MKTMFSEMAHYNSADWARFAGFVLLNVTMATGGTYYITTNLPPIRDGAMQSFVIPMGILSLLLFTALYPLLRRMTPGLPRLLALYGAFNVALLSLALFFMSFELMRPPAGGDIGELLRSMGVTLGLIIGCGHIYGLMPLLGIAAVNKVFSRLFFPRAAALGV